MRIYACLAEYFSPFCGWRQTGGRSTTGWAGNTFVPPQQQGWNGRRSPSAGTATWQRQNSVCPEPENRKYTNVWYRKQHVYVGHLEVFRRERLFCLEANNKKKC